MKREQIKQLAKHLNAENKYGKLQQALTHKSFYSRENEKKGNSKYVFLGMYAFKGKTAGLLYKYFSASGTQLQHFLGNLFKNKQLENIFDKYNLSELIRYGNNFDTEKHKHIFVYALLGFIIENCDKKTIKDFIFSNFLSGKEHLLPGSFNKTGIIAQCNYFAKILYKQKIQITIKGKKDTGYTVNVLAGSRLISKAESKSYKYARKKALKNALKKMSNTLAQKYFTTETYKYNKKILTEKQLIEKEHIRNTKIQKHQEKIALKKAENKKKRAQRKLKAQLKHQERLKKTNQ